MLKLLAVTFVCAYFLTFEASALPAASAATNEANDKEDGTQRAQLKDQLGLALADEEEDQVDNEMEEMMGKRFIPALAYRNHNYFKLRRNTKKPTVPAVNKRSSVMCYMNPVACFGRRLSRGVA